MRGLMNCEGDQTLLFQLALVGLRRIIGVVLSLSFRHGLCIGVRCV